MIRHRLDLERHGSDGFTTIARVVAVCGVVIALVLGMHLAVQSWYAGRIMPGVSVAGVSVGGMTRDEARMAIRAKSANYHLDLKIANEDFELKAEDLGVAFEPETTLEGAYGVNRAAWVPNAAATDVPLSYHVSRTTLVATVAAIVDKVGTPPVDASISLQGAQLVAVPDKPGYTVDRQALVGLIERDLAAPVGSAVQLKPREQLADIQASAVLPTIAEGTRLMATPVVLSYNEQIFTPTSAEIGKWLTFTKQQDETTAHLVPVVDASKLKAYIQQIANQIDIAPVAKKVTVENGVSKTTQEGTDGLAIDQDVLVKAITTAVSNGQALTMAITTHAVPYKTISNTLITLDYGKYIEINLRTQHLWVWQDHAVIYESPITSGATGAGFGTVTGLFSIFYKTTNTHLIGNQYGPRYNYDVFVKYWMPFYQGYGLHDASWRNGIFGGQDYYYGGSHGCVNLPEATAAFIYGWSEVGTPVWVHI